MYIGSNITPTKIYMANYQGSLSRSGRGECKFYWPLFQGCRHISIQFNALECKRWMEEIWKAEPSQYSRVKARLDLGIGSDFHGCQKAMEVHYSS